MSFLLTTYSRRLILTRVSFFSIIIIFKLSNYSILFNEGVKNAITHESAIFLVLGELIVYYATRFINGTLVTSFIRHERSVCLINECP
jgi:hypothetical protein